MTRSAGRTRHHRPRRRHLAQLAAVAALLLAPEVPLAAGRTAALEPLSIANLQGSSTGGVRALAVRDQDGGDNDPSRYVLFTTPGVSYAGFRSYQLPSGVAPASVNALRVEASYFGPVRSTQRWSWAMYDWGLRRWVPVGDNARAGAGEWTVLIFNVGIPRRFVSSTGRIRLRLDSSNSGGNARVDSEAVHVRYTPRVPPAPATGKIPAPPAGRLYHGVYPGGVTGEEDDLTFTDLDRYEHAAGKSAAWVYFSHNWFHGRAFPRSTASWIRRAGSTPYVRLMLRSDADGNHADPLYTLGRIVQGAFDSDLRAWCDGARDFGTPLIAEYGTEVNGSWFPWNGAWNGGGAFAGYGDPTQPDGPERFRNAYRRIVTICRAEGAGNITWVFHANDQDWPDVSWNRLQRYYPGDAYVDWLAVSVYGALTPLEREWPVFRTSMDAVYPRLAALSAAKPIFVAEFGVTARNPLGSQSKWAQDALADLIALRWPRIVGFSWWNERWENDGDPAHDTDMRLQANPALAAVFHSLVGANPVVLGTIP